MITLQPVYTYMQCIQSNQKLRDVHEGKAQLQTGWQDAITLPGPDDWARLKDGTEDAWSDDELELDAYVGFHPESIAWNDNEILLLGRYVIHLAITDIDWQAFVFDAGNTLRARAHFRIFREHQVAMRRPQSDSDDESTSLPEHLSDLSRVH